MQIIPLRAAHGDAIIIKEENKESPFTIVVDGGPEITAEDIVYQLKRLNHIDLLILTHYDEDHIFGLIKYFESLEERQQIIDEVWANCAGFVAFDDDCEISSMGNAFTLSTHLDTLQEKGVIGKWRFDVSNSMQPYTKGSFRITILSPTLNDLRSLDEKSADYVHSHGLDDPDTENDVSFAQLIQDSQKSFRDLFDENISGRTSFMNRTSIAFLLEADDKRILLMGDADAEIVAKSLESIGASIDSPLPIDLIKMSHHGSKSNISKHLFSLVKCENFLFTTNGGYGGAYHPDRKTLALLYDWTNKKHGGEITLYFNYPLDEIMKRNANLISAEERQLFNIIDRYSLGDTLLIEI